MTGEAESGETRGADLPERRSDFFDEREQLRARLAFPEPTEFPGRGARTGPHGGAPTDTDEELRSNDVAFDIAVARRLDKLGSTVDSLAALVERLFDRVEHMAVTLSQQPAPTTSGVDMSVIEDRMAAIGRALIDMKQLIERAPDQTQDAAILVLVEKLFDETSSRQADDVERLRIDLQRVDTALVDMHSRITNLPDREEMRELTAAPTHDSQEDELRHDLQRVDNTLNDTQARIAQLPDREALLEVAQWLARGNDDAIASLRAAIEGLPDQVALQHPAARLDESTAELLVARLAEASEGLTDKVDHLLVSRVQRFEALSQAMMTMVGDPVDALMAKLNEVVRRLDALEVPKPPSQ